MSDEVNEVTQADIDAAEEHYPPLFWKKAARDDLALAFARYRTAFQASAGECRSNQAAYEELRRFAQNIFNGLDTSMIRMDTPADETLANVLRRGRAALATLTTPVEASQPVGDAGEGLAAIAAERTRQIEVEGWSTEHDDEHADCQMAGAAACYAMSAIPHWAKHEAIRLLWPWSKDWWKPRSHRENLVRAGALIVAEIDRIDRAALNEGAA